MSKRQALRLKPSKFYNAAISRPVRDEVTRYDVYLGSVKLGHVERNDQVKGGPGWIAWRDRMTQGGYEEERNIGPGAMIWVNRAVGHDRALIEQAYRYQSPSEAAYFGVLKETSPGELGPRAKENPTRPTRTRTTRAGSARPTRLEYVGRDGAAYFHVFGRKAKMSGKKGGVCIQGVRIVNGQIVG